jgi:nitrate/nitrite transporter NarK
MLNITSFKRDVRSANILTDTLLGKTTNISCLFYSANAIAHIAFSVLFPAFCSTDFCLHPSDASICMVVLWADPSKEPFILSTEREPLQQT